MNRFNSYEPWERKKTTKGHSAYDSRSKWVRPKEEPLISFYDVSAIQWFGRFLLLLWWFAMLLTIIVGRHGGALELFHFTSWSWIAGFVFWTLVILGLFVRPVLKWTLVFFLVFYNGLVIFVALGIVVILIVDSSIVKDSEDEYDIGKIMAANFLLHYAPLVVFFITFSLALKNSAKIAFQRVFPYKDPVSAALFTVLQIWSTFVFFFAYLVCFDPGEVYNVEEVSWLVYYFVPIVLFGIVNTALLFYLLMSKASQFKRWRHWSDYDKRYKHQMKKKQKEKISEWTRRY